MLADEGQGENADDQGLTVAAVHQHSVDRGQGGGEDGGEGGVAGDEGDEEPGDQDGQAEQGVEGEEDAGGGSDALATLELEEDREQVAEEDGEGDQADDGIAQAQLFGDEDRQPALGAITDQGGQSRLLVAAT